MVYFKIKLKEECVNNKQNFAETIINLHKSNSFTYQITTETS